MEQLETSEEAKARGANSVSFYMLVVVWPCRLYKVPCKYFHCSAVLYKIWFDELHSFPFIFCSSLYV